MACDVSLTNARNTYPRKRIRGKYASGLGVEVFNDSDGEGGFLYFSISKLFGINMNFFEKHRHLCKRWGFSATFGKPHRRKTRFFSSFFAPRMIKIGL